MAKLHLRDRVHAVVLGYESGLITPGETNSSSPLRGRTGNSPSRTVYRSPRSDARHASRFLRFGCPSQ